MGLRRGTAQAKGGCGYAEVLADSNIHSMVADLNSTIVRVQQGGKSM